MSKGFTLLELLIVVVILGVLALIAAPTLLNAADKAKQGAVKANVSAAASTVTTHLTVEEKDGPTAATDSALQLNNAGTTDDDADNAKSPFAPDEDAFSTNAGGIAGQTVLIGEDAGYSVTITGYGKDGTTSLAVKTVSAPQEAASAAAGGDDDDEEEGGG